MKQKLFNQVVGYVFALGAILHGSRLVLGWEAVVAGWVVPLWVSGVALAIASYLAYTAFKLLK